MENPFRSGCESDPSLFIVPCYILGIGHIDCPTGLLLSPVTFNHYIKRYELQEM